MFIKIKALGDVVFCVNLFRTETTSEQVSGERFISRRISRGITYYYTPLSGAEEPTKDAPTSAAICPTPSSSPLFPESPSRTLASPSNQSDLPYASRPLLLFFSWLGAQPGPVAKYRDLYLDRGMDVLVVQSKVTHFLWPRWGLDYGLEVLKVLEEPQFAGRPVLVHASSIGGYTFTQILSHVTLEQKERAGLAQRVIGHIYDSLVVGTLEHMAIGGCESDPARVTSVFWTRVSDL